MSRQTDDQTAPQKFKDNACNCTMTDSFRVKKSDGSSVVSAPFPFNSILTADAIMCRRPMVQKINKGRHKYRNGGLTRR